MNNISSSRQPIIVGFSLMLALLLSMGALGLNYMAETQDRLANIVNIHNLRTDSINTMRNIARERSLLLYQMNLKRDFFFTDDTKIKMSNLAGEFIGIRQQLQALAASNSSALSIEDLMPDVIHSTSIQSDVIQLLVEERYDEANTLLSEKSIPAQDALLQRYDDLVSLEQKKARHAATEAAQHYRFSLYSMVTLGILLLSLGLFTSIFVLRRVTHAETQLRDLNSQLEERVNQRTQKLTQANNELETTLDQLKSAQSQLIQSEKMASLGSLVAGISHEVNTPVGIAMTAITLHQEQTLELEEKYQSGNIKRSQLEHFIADSRHNNDLIFENLRRATDLIASFKRVAVDQSQEHWETINLYDYLNNIILSLHPKLKHSLIQIDNRCDSTINFFTEPGAIYQIISNLILNSLLHAFDSEQEGHITIEGQLQSDTLLLTYFDDGKGMTAEQKSQAFDPFYTTKRGQGGSGLGLHLVYNLVTSALNGKIQLDSKPDHGSCFYIELPLNNHTAD